MSRTIYFISILIFIDLLFLITGQICSIGDCTLTSIIFNAILGIGELPLTTLFLELIGDFFNKLSSTTGVLSLLIGGATVIIGTYLASKDFRYALIPMAFALALLSSDFVTIAVRLLELNKTLGTIVMAPIAIIYILTIVDWLKGTD